MNTLKFQLPTIFSIFQMKLQLQHFKDSVPYLSVTTVMAFA